MKWINEIQNANKLTLSLEAECANVWGKKIILNNGSRGKEFEDNKKGS